MATLQEEYNACLFHSASALGRSLTMLADRHFRPAGITPTMGFILMIAKKAPGIKITDLALVHQLDASTISRTLDKMTALELVQREGQGREMRVFNTPKGMKKEAEAESAWGKLRVAYSLLLGEGDAKALAATTSNADGLLRKNR